LRAFVPWPSRYSGQRCVSSARAGSFYGSLRLSRSFSLPWGRTGFCRRVFPPSGGRLPPPGGEQDSIFCRRLSLSELLPGPLNSTWSSTRGSYFPEHGRQSFFPATAFPPPIFFSPGESSGTPVKAPRPPRPGNGRFTTGKSSPLGPSPFPRWVSPPALPPLFFLFLLFVVGSVLPFFSFRTRFFAGFSSLRAFSLTQFWRRFPPQGRRDPLYLRSTLRIPPPCPSHGPEIGHFPPRKRVGIQLPFVDAQFLVSSGFTMDFFPPPRLVLVLRVSLKGQTGYGFLGVLTLADACVTGLFPLAF